MYASAYSLYVREKLGMEECIYSLRGKSRKTYVSGEKISRMEAFIQEGKNSQMEYICEGKIKYSNSLLYERVVYC